MANQNSGIEMPIDRAFPDDYLTLIFPNMIYVDDE